MCICNVHLSRDFVEGDVAIGDSMVRCESGRVFIEFSKSLRGKLWRVHSHFIFFFLYFFASEHGKYVLFSERK